MTRLLALTLDDLPIASTTTARRERTIFRKVLAALGDFRIPALGFVIASRLHARHTELLDDFVSAGHQIGNHSYDHRSLDAKSLVAFERDLLLADKRLARWISNIRYFRYPLLRTGNSLTKRDGSLLILARHLYRPVWTTIDNSDYRLNKAYARGTARGSRGGSMSDRYIHHMLEQADRYDRLAARLLGRPIVHILGLHINDLAADNLHTLLREYVRDGWSFTSVARALVDPVYTLPDLRLGKRGVSWLYQLRRR